MLGAAACFDSPLVEEAAVAESEQGLRSESEAGCDFVDPIRRAFEFCKDADRCAVDNTVAGGVGIFGAPLFIDKGFSETEATKDRCQRFAILDCGLGFYAVFVAFGGVVVGGETLMGEHPAVAVLTNAQDCFVIAQGVRGGVEEGVALEGAGREFAKAEGQQLGRERIGIGDGEFHFDFNRTHVS